MTDRDEKFVIKQRTSNSKQGEESASVEQEDSAGDTDDDPGFREKANAHHTPSRCGPQPRRSKEALRR